MLYLKGSPLALSMLWENKSCWLFLMKSVPPALHSQILDKPEPFITISISWSLHMLKASRNHGWTGRDERRTEKLLCTPIFTLHPGPVDKMTAGRELIKSWFMKCLLSSRYMLETVLDHQRQSSGSEGEAAWQSRGFSHGGMGPGRGRRSHGLGRKESWASFALWARTLQLQVTETNLNYK